MHKVWQEDSRASQGQRGFNSASDSLASREHAASLEEALVWSRLAAHVPTATVYSQLLR